MEITIFAHFFFASTNLPLFILFSTRRKVKEEEKSVLQNSK